MRMPPNAAVRLGSTLTAVTASMEGGMRMPPNRCWTAGCSTSLLMLQWRAACACRRIRHRSTARLQRQSSASMEGGMRMPPNRREVELLDALNGASMEGGMRMPPNCRDGARGALQFGASMEGGMRMPPNRPVCVVSGRGCAHASMEGGMRMPPNHHQRRVRVGAVRASMEGGMRMPPNGQPPVRRRWPSTRFNGGRHAHAAESHARMRGSGRGCARFNGGRHAHAAESPPTAGTGGRRSSFNGGRHAHAAESVPPRRPRRHGFVASMEGGMRMPPNGPVRTRSARIGALQWRAACACRRIPRPARRPTSPNRLQWRAACACRRILKDVVAFLQSPHRFNGGRHAHAAEWRGARLPACTAGAVLQWRAACACRRIARTAPTPPA